jgi:hypothetical protein
MLQHVEEKHESEHESHFYPEDGGNTFLWNTGNRLQDWMRYEVLLAMKMLMLVSWVVTYGWVVSISSPEDGGSMFLQNTGIYLQVLMVLQPEDQHEHLQDYIMPHPKDHNPHFHCHKNIKSHKIKPLCLSSMREVKLFLSTVIRTSVKLSIQRNQSVTI